jgi:hypothetical protein
MRATATDYLQGEVLALAEKIGAPAPVNARLVRLVREAEAGVSGAGLRALANVERTRWRRAASGARRGASWRALAGLQRVAGHPRAEHGCRGQRKA